MSGTIRYTIRPYDTIWMLAQVFNTTVDSIMELNPGIDPRNLQIGQVVTLAPGYQYYNTSYPEPAESNTESGLDTDMDAGMYPGMSPDMSPGMDTGMEGSMMMDLASYLRLLWEQHVEWTRMAVMGIVHNLPEADLIQQRLLRNPVDFADALAHFYGEDAAQRFSDLFTAHLTIAAGLVKAAMAGDNDTYSNLERQWYDNADQIAAFLASINPYWNVEDWEAMLEEHLNLLAANIADMIAGNYADSIDGYDEIELQALEMADMMAEGISMQFPDL